MENREKILEKETQNDKFIFLYETLSGWKAFERSAFHFAQIFKAGKLILSDNLVAMEIDKEFSFLQSPAMRSGQIVLVDNGEVHFECNEPLRDFDNWRSGITEILIESK